MTGQDLLDRMELLNQELQLQASEANVTRGLLALNVAQDYFESLASQRGKLFVSAPGTITAASGIESTTLPAGIYRIDRLQLLDSSTLAPIRDIAPLKRTGGHIWNRYWPYNITVQATSGIPVSYWTNKRQIFWSPTPDADYSIRWYGFQAAASITAAGQFQYDDDLALPIASFAVRLYKSGLDDSPTDIGNLAVESFKQVLDQLSNFSRDGAVGFEYETIHTT